ERYWGTPLPLWRCPDGHEHVIGSREEIRELTGKDDVPELHRPYVDSIVFPCPECGKEMKRVDYVIDCWYDSGSAFFASHHYPFENKEEFKKQFPRDYIAEGIDQTRGWFYSLLAISTAVFDQPSYKNVICHALVLDGEGKKMSKSKGNVVDPWEVLNSEGADAIRWYLLFSSQPWKPKLFSKVGVNEANRSFLGTLRNVLGFYRTYSDLDGYKPLNRTDPKVRPDIDRWLLSKLNSLSRDVDERMMKFDLTGSAQAIKYFVVEELSNWYVRVNRRRFWGADDSEEKRTAYDTLAEALLTISKLVAPFAPFHAEKVYTTLEIEEKKDSVHFESYPSYVKDLIDETLQQNMERIKQVVELGRAARGVKNVKIRQPLRTAVIKGAGPFGEGLESIIRSELNVKNIDFEDDLSTFFEMTADPDPKRLGPKLKAASGKVRDELLMMDPKDLARIVKETGVDVEANGLSFHLDEEDFRFHEILSERWTLGGEGDIEVILDTRLDDGLKLEGIAREVVRRIQTMRKDLDLDYDARIMLKISGDDQVISGIRAFQDYILHETLADGLEIINDADGKEWEIDQGSLKISIS
ncbi:MAG: class I tRNA ligase family protein, partial [Candidatus Thermoplasmatota archaeon]|nr:class I tRNA ligase family protein [Candidatus Thermoplasmatota archaeon]